MTHIILRTLITLISMIYIFNSGINTEIVELRAETNFVQYWEDLELFTSGKLHVKPYNLSKKCKLCTFQVRNTLPNSTERDVVVAIGLKKAKSLIVYTKSLRTTGCKSRCVILLDTEAYLGVSKETHQIVKNCGGQIIDCGNFPNREGMNLCMFTYIVYNQFIRYNRMFFDRIILSDLYDTVFQGDPFNELFPNDKLYIIDEGSDFTTFTGWVNINWLYNKKDIIKDLSQKYFCAGFIGGTTEIMIKTLNIYIREASVHPIVDNDQAIFNYLYFTGEFAKNGIDFVGERENELVHHLAVIKAKNTTLGYVEAMRDPTLYATVIHHYYVEGDAGKVEDSIETFCPKDFSSLEYYTKNSPN